MTRISFKEWLLIAAAGIFFVYFNPAYADTVTGDLEVQSDNEGLSTQRYLLGYRDMFGDWVLGVKVGQFRVKDNSGRVNFDEVRFTWYREFDNKLSTWGYLGYLDSGTWSLPTGDLGVGYVYNERLYLEGGVTRNNFDTFQTQISRVAYTSYTGRAEYEYTYNLKFTGIATVGNTTDSNNFNAFEAHADYQLPIVQGLTLKYQHRYKGFGNNEPEYFSPSNWNRDLFGVGYKKKFDEQWSFKGHLLTGPQSVDSESGLFTELKTYVQWKPTSRSTLKFTHDRVISEVNGYNYHWNWTGLQFLYNF